MAGPAVPPTTALRWEILTLSFYKRCDFSLFHQISSLIGTIYSMSSSRGILKWMCINTCSIMCHCFSIKMNSARDTRFIVDFTNSVRVTTKMPETEKQANIYQLDECERHLIRACEQVILLNGTIKNLVKRYESAKTEGFRSFRYNLRMRLSVW